MQSSSVAATRNARMSCLNVGAGNAANAAAARAAAAAARAAARGVPARTKVMGGGESSSDSSPSLLSSLEPLG
jgi:hypothetical protein